MDHNAEVRQFRAYFELGERAGLRSVIATLSTTTPFKRQRGNEILMHTPEAIDLSRFPLPIVLNHQAGSMPAIGRAKNPRIIGDALKVDLVFGNSKAADETWDDIQDGIATHMSAGYTVIERTDTDPATLNYYVTKWIPLEASIVPIPADINSVIGRSAINNAVNRSQNDERFEEMTNKKVESMRNYFSGYQSTNTIGGELQAIIRQSIPALAGNSRALGLGESNLSEGGFLVNPAFSEKLLFGKYASEVVKRCLSVRYAGEGFEINLPYMLSDDRTAGRFNGLISYQIMEGSDKTASTPAFANLNMKLNKTAVLSYMTDELVGDSNALERLYTYAASSELTYDMERQIITGNGAGEYLGIRNSGALITVPKVALQGAATVVPENIAGMVGRLLSDSHNSAGTCWLVSAEVMPQLYLLNQIAATEGSHVNLFQFTGPGEPNLLCGFPVIVSDHCPRLGLEGDIMLADLEKYILIQKAVKSAISCHVRWSQDESVFRTVLRSAGNPLVNKPIIPAQSTAGLVVSPFVSLALRA